MKHQWTANSKNVSLLMTEEHGIVEIQDILLGRESRGVPASLALPQRYLKADEETPFRWSPVREEVQENGFSVLFSDEDAG